MRNLLIVFFITILLLLLIFLPFKTRLMFHLNLFETKTYYSLKVIFIKILCGMVFMKDGKLYVSNIDGPITFSSSKFTRFLILNILSKIDVKKVEIFFTGGFADNSFNSALLCGSVSAVVQTFYSILSQKFENVKLYEDIAPTFNKDNLEVTVDVVVSLSIFQLFVSIISAAFRNNKLKESKNEG